MACSGANFTLPVGTTLYTIITVLYMMPTALSVEPWRMVVQVLQRCMLSVYFVLLYEQKPIKINLFSDARNFLNKIPKTVLLEAMQTTGGK